MLSEHLGNVSDDAVWRILRQHRISLARRRSFCVSTDPEFAPKAADIGGLYLDPPENAFRGYLLQGQGQLHQGRVNGCPVYFRVTHTLIRMSS